MMNFYRILPLLLASLLWGCGVDEEAQFEQDFSEDFEADAEEESAQAEEFDALAALEDPEVDPTEEVIAGEADAAEGALRRALGLRGSPLSIMEDDPHFSGEVVEEWAECGRKRSRYDEAAARAHLQEAKDLGVDIIRVMVSWAGALPCELRRTTQRPPKFEALKPRSYQWAQYDTEVRVAQELGLKVLITLAAPMPYWGSEEPAYCAVRDVEDPRFWSCGWKPRLREYAQFVYAAGKHFAALTRQTGRPIWGWTLWNEPNHAGFLGSGDAFTGEGQPAACINDRDHCRTQAATAQRYRAMWFTGLRHLRLSNCQKFARQDGRRVCARSRHARVFYGDLANEAGADSNHDFLARSVCLGSDGCPRKVYTRGVALHPYARSLQGALDAVSAVRAVLDRKEAERRIAGASARGLYSTEAGFRTQRGQVSVTQQGPLFDQVELALADRGLKTVAQYELYDEGRDGFECGLRFAAQQEGTVYKVRDYERYLCHVSEGLKLLDASCQGACAPACAQGKTCKPCQDPQGNDLAGKALDECVAKLRGCNQQARALALQPKPAYPHYQMPVTARRAGDKVELRVLARASQPNETLIVEGVQANGMPLAVGVIPVDRHGYGVASIPAGPFGSYRVIDHTRRLARQVPAP